MRSGAVCGATSSPASGTFAAPDILSHASFETNNSEGGLFSNNAGGGPDWVRDNGQASLGSWSAKMPVVPTPSSDAGGRQNWIDWTTFGKSSVDRVFVAFDFYSTCIVDSSLKWMRFHTAGGLQAEGGLEFNDVIDIWMDQENIGAGRYVSSTGVSTSGLLNAWHHYEIDYRRVGTNSDPGQDGSTWPSMAFWIDGVQQGQPDGNLGGAPATNAYWSNKRYYAGERANSSQLGTILMIGTLTQGNTQTGTQWIDNISISTQRIG